MRTLLVGILTLAFSVLQVVVSPSASEAQGPREAPDSVVAALAIKIINLEKGLSDAGEITVHVIGSSSLADALDDFVGKKVGKATIKKVTESEGLPEAKPHVLVLANEALYEQIIEYSRRNKVLSFTNKPALVIQGITVGIGVGEDNKPKILLNLSASKAEGMDWNPLMFKVAATIE